MLKRGAISILSFYRLSILSLKEGQQRKEVEFDDLGKDQEDQQTLLYPEDDDDDDDDDADDAYNAYDDDNAVYACIIIIFLIVGKWPGDPVHPSYGKEEEKHQSDSTNNPGIVVYDQSSSQ